jgi:PAS domain S-box-containing protein
MSRAQLEDILGAGFFNAFDPAAIGMALADLHGRCLAANPPLCAMLEYDESELLGRSFQPFTLPDDLPENLSQGRRLIAGEIASFQLEKRYISKSGRVIPVLLSASLMRDAAGQPWGVMSQLQDISARKQAEDALHYNEELYRTLVETSPDAIVMSDPTGIILFCNAQHAALYGYERAEDMVGLDSMQFFAPQSRAHTRAKLELAVEIGAIRQAEYTLFRKDGSTFIGEFSVTPIYGVCGHARAHMAVVRDISARKTMEDALRRSEELYRTLVETSPDAIAMADQNGVILFCNAQHVALYGYERAEEMVGLNALVFFTPQDRARAQATLEQTLLTGTVRHAEYTLVRKDGSTFLGELSVTPMRDEQGQPHAFIAVVRDITKRKQDIRSLQQSEERYRAIVEDQSEMVCRFGPDTVLTFVNDAYCRHLGKPRTELVGHSFLEWVPPETRPVIRAHLQSLTNNPRIESYEHEVLTPAGERRWHEWIDRPIFDELGRLVDFQSVGRDITKRKKAEHAEHEQRLLAEALRDSAAALSSALSLDEVLERLLSNASRVVPNDAVNIMLIDAARNEAYVVRAHGYAGRGAGEQVRGLRFNLDSVRNLQQMITSGQPLIIPDVTLDPAWVNLLEWNWQRSYAAVPIRAGRKTVGFVNFDSATPAFFNAAHIERLQAFADQAAVAIEKAQLFEATQRSVQRLTLLHQAALELAKIESTEALHNEILRLTCTLAAATRATLNLYDGKEHLVTTAIANVPAEVIGSRIRLGEGLNGSVAQTRRPMHMSNYQVWDGRLLTYSTLGIVSMVAVPLIWQDQLVGTLSVADEHEREFDDDDMHMLELFASLAAAALEQHRAVAEAQARESEANALSARLSHAQEEERVRIAEQLHDTIGYRLVTLQKSIEMTLATLGTAHPLAEHLTRHLDVLKETHQLARSLAMDLDSKVLADLGISPAARQYVDRLAVSTGMPIRLHVTGRVRRLPADVERVAFRSLQETVNNALRHAGGTEIAAQLHFGTKTLRLTVQDNGRGFDVDAQRLNSKETAALGGTALGLPELHRQVKLIKGELLVESVPGQGAIVVLNLPIHPAATHERSKPRVLLVDDHEITRQGLRLQLAQSGEFTCIGEASDGISALHQVELHRPDLVLMDINLPTLGGIESTRQITRRFPHLGVVILTYYEEEVYLQQAFEAGARGYVLKRDESQHIIQALRAVHEDETYVSPQLAAAWARLQDSAPIHHPLDMLTMREHEVFELIIAGHRNRSIAAKLGLSVRTVEFYRKNIMSKLGVKNLPQLIQFATRNHMMGRAGE